MAAVLPRVPAAVLNGTATDKPAQLATVTAANEPVPIVYGEDTIGAYIGPVGEISGDTVIAFLWCLGEIEAVVSVTINGQTPDASITQTHYTGTAAQGVDATLAAAISGYADTMTATINGTTVGLAYSVFRFPPGTYSGFPRAEAKLQGMKNIYDPRDLSTGYSTNPSLITRDFATSSIYGAGLTIDGTGCGNCADANDALMSDGNPRRTLNLSMIKSAPVAQWLDTLRTYAGCFIFRRGTTLMMAPDRPASSVASLTDSNVVKGSLKLSTRGRRPTVVRVMWTDTSATPWRSMPAIAKAAGVDAGTTPWREEVVQLPGINNYAQAYQEAVERLNAATLTDLDAEFVTQDEALAYEEGDVIDLTHSIGLTAKTLRILGKTRSSTGRWLLTTAEYDNVYSDTVVSNPGNNTNLSKPDYIAPPTGLTCASGTAQLLALDDGTIISRILVTVDASTDPFFSALEVDFQKSSDTNASHAPDSKENSAYCTPVEDGVTYAISARFRNSFGIVSDWTTTNHVVVGKSEAPGPVTSFLFSRDADGTRRFTWNWPSPKPADLAGAIISSGLGTGVTIGSMTAMHDGELTSSPWENNLLAAGTYTFAAQTVDTTGNLSTPVYIDATLGDPRLAGALAIQQSHLDGWPGTLSNCFIDSNDTGWLLATDTKTWDDLTTDGITWDAWTQWTRAPNTLVYTGEVIDVGVVTTFTPLLSAEYAGTPTLEIRTSDDNVTWSSWAAPAGAVTHRYVQGRATIAPIGTALTALKTMTLMLDAQPQTEDINDLDISTLTGSYRIGTGDIRLPITKSYAAINIVLPIMQNVGPGWTCELIDKDTAVGPRMKFYNGSGTLADCTIDANIRGVPA